MSTVLGLLSSVAPFTDGWAQGQRLIFVVGVVLIGFIFGALLVGFLQSVIPALWSSDKERTHDSASIDDARLTSIEVIQERNRADIAEARVRQLLQDNDMLSTSFRQSEEDKREHAERERVAREAQTAAQGAQIASKIELHDLGAKRESERPNREWVDQLLKQETPLLRWLTVVSTTCQFQNIRKEIGPHFFIILELRYFGVLPISIGSPQRGHVAYHDGIMGQAPETGGAAMRRGQQQPLYVLQRVGDSEARTIEKDLATNGKAVIDASHVHLTATAELPDGTIISEDYTLPYSIEGPNPWPSAPST